MFTEQLECDMETQKRCKNGMCCARLPSFLFNHLGGKCPRHRDGCSFTGQQCFEHDVSERAHLTGESSANDRLDIVGREVTVSGGSGGGKGGVYIW